MALDRTTHKYAGMPDRTCSHKEQMQPGETAYGRKALHSHLMMLLVHFNYAKIRVILGGREEQ